MVNSYEFHEKLIHQFRINFKTNPGISFQKDSQEIHQLLSDQMIFKIKSSSIHGIALSEVLRVENKKKFRKSSQGIAVLSF